MVYVTMTDRFMSGWGMAQGKTNKLIFECEDMKEAKIVAENARYRSEMKYINICTKKPSYNSRNYYAQVKTKDEYENWYKEGYFAK